MHRKLVYLALILPSIFISTAASTSHIAMAQSSSELATYTDTNNGFTLQYPLNWTRNEYSSELVLISPDYSGTVFVTTIDPSSADQIEVVRNMTLDELVMSVALPAGAMSLPPNELDDLGINIVELNSEGYFLSGHPAGRMVMTLAYSTPSKTMWLATNVNDKLYAISYVADTTTYNQYLADAQTIFDSFKIISNQ